MEESKAMDELLNERDELVRENSALRQENQELSELLKDYEKGLETTTSLIRDQAVPIPSNKLLIAVPSLPPNIPNPSRL
jgi:regulator of replication initiation timing